jgi:cell division protein FtsI/penicillin-binding protein 2
VTLRDLGASGKTGTAELTSAGDNNAWFAGYLPGASAGGVRLAFCAVVYFVPDSEHGAEAAGGLLEGVLRQVARDPKLSWRYLPR